LYNVPYQGTPLRRGNKPLTSRHSSVPKAAAITAADGPPRTAMATIGATTTLSMAPLGMRTGTAELRTTTAIQKATPQLPPMSGAIGYSKKQATASRVAAPVTKPTMTFTRRGRPKPPVREVDTKKVWRHREGLHTGSLVLVEDRSSRAVLLRHWQRESAKRSLRPVPSALGSCDSLLYQDLIPRFGSIGAHSIWDPAQPEPVL
jgi:hypothetical protein